MQLRTTWIIGVSLACACGDDGVREDSMSAGSMTTTPTSATISTSAPTTSGATDGESSPTTSGGSMTGTSEPTTQATQTTQTSETAGTDPGTTGTASDPGTTGDPSETTGPPVDLCKVQDDMNAIGECDKEAPSDSFEPEVQWAWTGPNGEIYAVVTPLVANLTDDNGDGAIDLCDIPDIVVPASAGVGVTPGHIYVLDGATGTLHFMLATAVDATVTPALGDIDGDGLPEIISATAEGQLLAWEHDGTQKWTGGMWNSAYIAALGLADVDNDGYVV